jgi:hypothetical protein
MLGPSRHLVVLRHFEGCKMHRLVPDESSDYELESTYQSRLLTSSQALEARLTFPDLEQVQRHAVATLERNYKDRMFTCVYTHNSLLPEKLGALWKLTRQRLNACLSDK